MNKTKLTEPISDLEFEAYYHCRWEVLRKPWGQPKGSEKAPDDEESEHVMAVDNYDHVCGVARLTVLDKTTAQIRFMGVKDQNTGKGIGASLLNYLENLAKAKGAKKIMLHAREIALPFYRKLGYSTIEKSHLLWNEIQHFKMEKVIT